MFATMQLADAAIMLSSPSWARWLSRYVLPLVLGGELLVSYYGGVWATGRSDTGFEIVLWCSVVTLVGSWVALCQHPTSRSSDGYLVWCDMEMHGVLKWGFLVILLYPFVTWYPTSTAKYWLLSIIGGTFLWNYPRRAFGSRWCWTANLLSLVLLTQ